MIKTARLNEVPSDVVALARDSFRGTTNFPGHEHDTFDDYELRMVPLDKITPSQTGEDYDNDSSRELSRHIGEFGKSGRLQDYEPIIVDKNMRILDGNHRHAARKIAGIKYIPALVQKTAPLSPTSKVFKGRKKC